MQMRARSRRFLVIRTTVLRLSHLHRTPTQKHPAIISLYELLFNFTLAFSRWKPLTDPRMYTAVAGLYSLTSPRAEIEYTEINSQLSCAGGMGCPVGLLLYCVRLHTFIHIEL